MHRYVGSLFRQFQSDSTPDTPRSTGNQSVFSSECHKHLPMGQRSYIDSRRLERLLTFAFYSLTMDLHGTPDEKAVAGVRLDFPVHHRAFLLAILRGDQVWLRPTFFGYRAQTRFQPGEKKSPRPRP